MADRFNLFDPALREDPYPIYAALRERAPVAPVDPIDGFLVTRFDDVVSVLRSPELFSSRAMHTAMLDPGEAEDEGPPPMIISIDAPRHTRMRALVNRGFTPRRIGRLEGRIRAITRSLFHSIDERDTFDLVTDLTVPLPVRVIAELLGVEPDRFEDFKRWSTALIATFGRLASAEESARADAAGDELGDYLDATIEARRACPRDDLISVLIEKGDDGELSVDEIRGFTILLLIAGNETTTNLLGNATVALLEHPGQLEKVLADPTRIPNLVEETLRYHSPVQLLFRSATQDVELGGVKIPEGAFVLPSYAAANRDPRRFPNPDCFDVDRNAQGHVAFGLGVHYCLGAGLARLEATVALEALVPRLAKLCLREPRVQWNESVILRGPARLRLGSLHR